MELVMTPHEVVAQAFDNLHEIYTEHIHPETIAVAQRKFIKPVVNGLYGNILDGEYTLLTEKYIKPALALYVKCLVLPRIATLTGRAGVFRVKGESFEAAQESTVADLCRRIRSEATTIMKSATEHIEADSAAYPGYSLELNVLNRVSIESNIVLAGGHYD